MLALPTKRAGTYRYYNKLVFP